MPRSGSGVHDMPGQLPVQLNRVVIVLTAQFYPPAALDHDILRMTKVIPEDWEPLTDDHPVVPGIQTAVRFRNGVEWHMNPMKLAISQQCDGRFTEQYLIQDLAVRYIRTFPRIPYQNLGLNWAVSMANADPDRWLARRFLKEKDWLPDGPAIISMRPTFTLDAGDAICNLDFGTGQTHQPDGNSEQVVIVECNIHHPHELSAEQLEKAITEWPARQQLVVAALRDLVGELQT